MKCLGLIGGLTAPNLDTYWQTIRSEAQKNLGPDQMPRFLVHSVKTRDLKASFDQADWSGLTEGLAESGSALAGAGADCIVICGSALNPAAPEINRILNVPVIDLGYSLALKVRSLQYSKIAILGIRTSREETMWHESLRDVEIAQPDSCDRGWLAGCIEAAAVGRPIPVEWKIETNRIVSGLRRDGSQALVLADAALGRWIKPGQTLLYPIDAAEVHAWTATLWALQADFLPAPGCVFEA